MCLDTRGKGRGFELASLERAPVATHVPGTSTCQDVAVTTLDKFAAQQHITHIDVAKIDTEGFDGRAILGGLGLLTARRITALVFECCHLWSRGAVPPGAFFRAAAGFKRPDVAEDGTAKEGHMHPLVDLVKAAEVWGYDTLLLGSRNVLTDSDRAIVRAR
eukprot:4512286-Prymnesium_polylepis.1